MKGKEGGGSGGEGDGNGRGGRSRAYFARRCVEFQMSAEDRLGRVRVNVIAALH